MYYIAVGGFQADGVQYANGQLVPSSTTNIQRLNENGLVVKLEGTPPNPLPVPDPPSSSLSGNQNTA